jgi:V/A-type H+-transporting ATPase subunit K
MTALLIATVTLALPLTLAVLARLASPRAESLRTENSSSTRNRLRRAIIVHVLIFGVIYLGVLSWAVRAAAAQEPGTGTSVAGTSTSAGLSVGDGIAMLGIALATGLSVLGAGYAVGVVGSAALGAITEKPEMFGRTLVFIGLAEGLAIYGLIVSILLLERLR